MLIEHWEQAGAKLARLAEAVPEDRFEVAPVASMRTFEAVLRHVAFWNRYVADSARGAKTEEAANELPKNVYSTKAQVIAALVKSTEDAAAALRPHREGLAPETAAMVESFIEHVSEHYGQLVVYAHLAGVVPPASRG